MPTRLIVQDAIHCAACGCAWREVCCLDQLIALLRQCSVVLVGALTMLPPLGGKSGGRTGDGEMVPARMGVTEISRPISSPDLHPHRLHLAFQQPRKLQGVVSFSGGASISSGNPWKQTGPRGKCCAAAMHEMQTLFAGVCAD